MPRPKKASSSFNHADQPAKIAGWFPSSAFILAAKRPGATLGVTIGLNSESKSFGVIALSTPSLDSSIDAILEEHAHKNLGEFQSLFAAAAAAEAFVADWIKGTPIDRCGCKEM